MNDKELFFQILNREIDNFLGNFSPIVHMMSGSIKNYVFSFVEPYIDAFLSPQGQKLNTDAINSFVKDEVNTKVSNFLKKFEKEKSGGSYPNDYIV
jgi:hypothetical protein